MNSIDKGAAYLDRLAADKVQAVDLFNRFSLPEFPVELLPPIVREYAADQSELIGVDPAVIGVSSLAVAAACIDDRIEIQPKRHDTGWTESARLWIGIIGDPSAKKSPGLKKALSPAFAVDADWRKESAQKLTQWQEQCESLTKDEPKPEKPILKRLIVDDVTVEKLAMIAAESEPRGILSFRDELSGWLSTMDAYHGGAGGKDKAAWLEAYNGGPKAIDRVTRGSLFVENWSACVLGGIQPGVIHSYAKATNHDGMLQRFILVKAGQARLGADRPPNSQIRDDYRQLISDLSRIEPSLDAVKLSDEAQEIRKGYEEKLHKAIISFDNAFLTATLGKWSGTYARLLLIYHCIECSMDAIYPASRPVSANTARKVSDLVWQVLFPHAIEFYQGMDETEENARLLAALMLAKQWPRFTVKRDLAQQWKHSRKMKPWEIDTTLDRLESYGWIWPDDAAGLNERGRPVAYMVNAEIHQRFTEQAAAEKARRKEVATMMRELAR